MSACPESCRSLATKYRTFVHSIVAGQLQHQAWKDAGSRAKSERSLKVTASMVRKREDVDQAIRDHFAQVTELAAGKAEEAALEIEEEGIEVDLSRATQLRRLALRSSANLSDFLTVRCPVVAEPERLRQIADMEDPAERSEAVRRLLAIEVIPWEDIPRDRLAQIAEVRQNKDGTIVYKLHPAGPAETLLADIQGHKAPSQVEVLGAAQVVIDLLNAGEVEAAREVAGDTSLAPTYANRLRLAAILEGAKG